MRVRAARHPPGAMPPKAAAAAKGAAGTPLDKRMAANQGKEEIAHWNISELKQNLQEDTMVLEQTLREANKLLGETAGVPMVDIKGQVSKEAQLKRLKELMPEEAADAARQSDGAGRSGSPPGGSPGRGSQPRADVLSGTFMTQLDVSSVRNVPSLLGPVQTRMSEELELRLSVLEEAIGREATQLLKLTIQSDLDQVCRLARKDEAAKFAKKSTATGKTGGRSGGVDIEEMEAQLREEEALKLQAQEQVSVLKENLRMQSTRLAEMQERTTLLDTSSQEFGETLRKKDAETKSLRDELLAAQHKTRVEEGERHKLVEKLRKKEVEMTKSKESMDKMTMQMQRLGEERDKMHAMLEETRSKHAQTEQREKALKADLDKLQAAERVHKRNMQLQMPDETKKVVSRIEQLEKVNKDLSEKLRVLKDTEAAEIEKKRLKSELTDLRVHNQALTKTLDELRKDKDHSERASEAQRRLLENRTRILLDKNTKSTQKLQGETELRIAERLHNRSTDNEVAALRKRNLDVLSKLNVLEEQRMTEQSLLRDSQRRCSELSEKLELYATVHRIDMARLQFSPDVRAELAAEQKPSHSKSATRLRRSTAGSRASTAGGVDGRMSAPPELGAGASDSRPPLGSVAPRPASSASGGLSGGTNEYLRANARIEVAENDTLEGLRHKVRELQSKVNSEERARTQAQDRCVTLAEQLLEKEAALQKVQAGAENEKTSGRRNKKSDRLRELEAQVMSQTTKMRETEMDKDQVEIKLNQKEEESRIKARKISDLIFKMSQVEEEAARLAEELIETKSQLAKTQKVLDDLTTANALEAEGGAGGLKRPVSREKSVANPMEEGGETRHGGASKSPPKLEKQSVTTTAGGVRQRSEAVTVTTETVPAAEEVNADQAGVQQESKNSGDGLRERVVAGEL